MRIKCSLIRIKSGDLEFSRVRPRLPRERFRNSFSQNTREEAPPRPREERYSPRMEGNAERGDKEWNKEDIRQKEKGQVMRKRVNGEKRNREMGKYMK